MVPCPVCIGAGWWDKATYSPVHFRLGEEPKGSGPMYVKCLYCKGKGVCLPVK